MTPLKIASILKFQRVPEANAQWSENGTINYLPDVDISVAVATDSGLITPIVKDASSLGIEAISKIVKVIDLNEILMK